VQLRLVLGDLAEQHVAREMNMPAFHRYDRSARYSRAVSRSGFSTNFSTSAASGAPATTSSPAFFM
jgi:hypothetical protein